jgi:hypothetical protein
MALLSPDGIAGLASGWLAEKFKYLLEMPDLFIDGFAEGGGYCSGKLSLAFKDVANAGQGTAHVWAMPPCSRSRL